MKTHKYLFLIFMALPCLCTFSFSPPFTVDFKYEGEKNVEGKPHGFGMAKLMNGDTYEGQFKNGLASGKGTYISVGLTDTDPEAYKYTGNFEAGLFEGHGDIKFKNGFQYIGNFRKGYFHGSGKRRYSNGANCEGEFKNDRLNGKGMCNFPNYVYSGLFKNDVPFGKGTMKFNDGSSLSGQFTGNDLSNANLLHAVVGQATLVTKDNLQIEGKVSAGEFIDKVAVKLPDGKLYNGEVRNMQFNGHGELTNPGVFFYAGRFSDGEFNGNGKLIMYKNDNNPEELTFEGSFMGGKPQEGKCNGEPCIYTNKGFQLSTK